MGRPSAGAGDRSCQIIGDHLFEDSEDPSSQILSVRLGQTLGQGFAVPWNGLDEFDCDRDF